VLDVAEGLDVVDDGGAHVEPEHGGEIGGLDARVGALAFERFDQPGFLAADVGARAAVNVDFEIVAGAANALAEKVFRLGLGNRLLEDFRAKHEFAPDIDIGEMDVVGIARDDHPFEHLVRVLVDDLAVLEGAGLRFVGVADEIDRLGVFLGIDEAPFHAAGKSGAAAPAQLGGLDLGDDVGPLHGEGFFQVLVAVLAQIAIDVDGISRLVDILEDQSVFSDGHK